MRVIVPEASISAPTSSYRFHKYCVLAGCVYMQPIFDGLAALRPDAPGYTICESGLDALVDGVVRLVGEGRVESREEPCRLAGAKLAVILQRVR